VNIVDELDHERVSGCQIANAGGLSNRQRARRPTFSPQLFRIAVTRDAASALCLPVHTAKTVTPARFVTGREIVF
jgi:hypothetical protein